MTVRWKQVTKATIKTDQDEELKKRKEDISSKGEMDGTVVQDHQKRHQNNGVGSRK